MGQALGAKASAVTIFIICGTISTFGTLPSTQRTS